MDREIANLKRRMAALEEKARRGDFVYSLLRIIALLALAAILGVLCLDYFYGIHFGLAI